MSFDQQVFDELLFGAMSFDSVFDGAIFDGAFFDTGEDVVPQSEPAFHGAASNKRKRRKVKYYSDEPETVFRVIAAPVAIVAGIPIEHEENDDELILMALARVLH